MKLVELRCFSRSELVGDGASIVAHSADEDGVRVEGGQ